MTRQDGTASRSGTSGPTTPRERRTRRRIELTLDPSTITALADRAQSRGVSISRLVEEIVRAELATLARFSALGARARGKS